MFNSNTIDKAEFILFMERLKNENQQYKQLSGSKELKMGVYLRDFINAFKSLESLKKFIKNTDGKFRWKLLCRKYPIRHPDSYNTECNYFSDEKFIVYTCIFGNYDIPQEPLFKPDNCEFYIITDQDVPDGSLWRKIDVKEQIPGYDGLTNAEKNRFCKMMPHVIFPDVRKSVYIDGNIKVVSDLTEFINKDLRCGMQFHNHKARTCVYDEIEACKIIRKASSQSLNDYGKYLQKQGFPKHYGMVECNVIVRDHCNERTCRIMEQWWDDFLNHTVKRDQLSLPCLLWKNGIKIDQVNKLGNNVQDNPALRVTGHR
ncbi:MAG: DUF616 domain-containing protein [Lachnospiraceae bacterium]|nr:DUF616 domain-containing protein [Lachnospiraceae bacterium]